MQAWPPTARARDDNWQPGFQAAGATPSGHQPEPAQGRQRIARRWSRGLRGRHGHPQIQELDRCRARSCITRPDRAGGVGSADSGGCWSWDALLLTNRRLGTRLIGFLCSPLGERHDEILWCGDSAEGIWPDPPLRCPDRPTGDGWQPGCQARSALFLHCCSDRFQQGCVQVFFDVCGIDLNSEPPCPIL